MEDNARDFIYLDAGRYISLDFLRKLYWGIIILPIAMLVIGIASIKMSGIHWKSMFPFVSIAIWSLCYWVFVLKVGSWKTKPTFQLRFLVNGITEVLLSFLFWIVYATICLIADPAPADFGFCLWILVAYLLFSVTYIALIVRGVRKGAFKKVKKKFLAPKVLAIDAFFASLIPVAGSLGWRVARTTRAQTSMETKILTLQFGFPFLIFCFALGHINFVKYYYCIKYKIFCDENGDTLSRELM